MTHPLGLIKNTQENSVFIIMRHSDSSKPGIGARGANALATTLPNYRPLAVSHPSMCAATASQPGSSITLWPIPEKNTGSVRYARAVARTSSA